MLRDKPHMGDLRPPRGDINASAYLQTKANTLFLCAFRDSVLGNLSKNWIG